MELNELKHIWQTLSDEKLIDKKIAEENIERITQIKSSKTVGKLTRKIRNDYWITMITAALIVTITIFSTIFLAAREQQLPAQGYVFFLLTFGFYAYKVFGDNPVEISNPVYMESRVTLDVPDTSREVEVIFLGEMVSQEDCEKRSENYLANLLESCQVCNIKLTECKLEIHSRNKKLFSNRKAHTTYLSLTKGNRFERNGRLVVWGLNDEEAKMLCSEIKNNIGEKYNGTAQCI